MTSTLLTPADVLAKLQENVSTIDEITILTYINNDNRRTNLLQIMTDNQYSDLCNLIINFITREQQQQQPEEENGDGSGSSLKISEIKLLFNNIINESTKKIPFFKQSLTVVTRNKRLKIFDLIKSIKDKQLMKLVNDDDDQQDTCKFLNDCLRDVEVTKMEWLSPTICTDNNLLLLPMLEQAEKKPTDFEDFIIYNTLDFINRIYTVYNNSSSFVNSNFNIRQFHHLVLDKVVTLLYMGHKHQRAKALNLFETAIKTDFHSYIRQNHEETWTAYRSRLQNVYHIRMLSLVKASEPDWYRQWCLSIQALGTDLHRGADLINNLLSVEERAFKSPDMSIRIQAFHAWKLLIDNFTTVEHHPTTTTTQQQQQQQQLATITRRIKLLCIPLNANNNKTESIALTKFQVWRYLIIKLSSSSSSLSSSSLTSDKSLNQVVDQFLNFCFGPLGDTPLLSTKSGIQSSPGKRFIKARKCAVNSLLELLISNPQNRALLFSKNDNHHDDDDDNNNTINAISQQMFQESFNKYIHSVGEASLLINDDYSAAAAEFVFDKNNRETLNRVLWQSLFHLINNSTDDDDDELKPKMYRELILIICEVVNHIRVRDDCTNSLLLDIIVPELVKVSSNYLLYRDQTLMDLLIRLLDPEFLKRPNTNLKTLILHAIRPAAAAAEATISSSSSTAFHPGFLPFLKSVLSQMIALGTTNVNLIGFVMEIWIELAELLVIFIKTTNYQSINEGTLLTTHNFDTAYSLIIFPFKIKWISNCNSNNNNHHHNQLIKISRCWKDLYTNFNIAADLIATVKTNEVLDHVAEDLLMLISISNSTTTTTTTKDKDNKSYRFICYVFDALMNTIHYSDYLAVEQVPKFTSLLRDVTFATLEQGEHINEIEYSLKSMASLLITIYGLEQSKAQFHLTVLKPCIELMLKINIPECVKEVINTWETVIIILKGLTNCLSFEFINSYREALIDALSHSSQEIAAQTMSFLDDIRDSSSSSSSSIKKILNEVELEASKKVVVTTSLMNNAAAAKKKKKHVRVTGSFLGKKSIITTTTPPVTKVSSSGGKRGKEKRVSILPPPPPSSSSLEPDSQDYVLIQNDVKVNVDLLTEHQKECFKRHRDDIPAMYNDLSQSSGSRNTQELEEWFKIKASGSTEATTTTDDNKENKEEEEEVTKENKERSEEVVVVGGDGGDDDSQELSPETTGDQIDESSIDVAVKKLNFESREEFPADENDENTQEKDLIFHSHRAAAAATGSIRPGRRGKRGRRRGGGGGGGGGGGRISRLSRQQQNKGLKRKAATATTADSDEFVKFKKCRYSALDVQNDTDDNNDTESFCSNESEKFPPPPTLPPSSSSSSSVEGLMNTGTGTGVSQRTKKEMSRLKIDMVFDSRKKSKLRNKVYENQRNNKSSSFSSNDDFVYEKVNKRHSLDPEKLMKKTTRSSGDSLLVEQQSLLFARRKRRRKDPPLRPSQEKEFKSFVNPMSSPPPSPPSTSSPGSYSLTAAAAAADDDDDDDDDNNEIVENSQDLCSVRCSPSSSSSKREKKTADEKFEVAVVELVPPKQLLLPPAPSPSSSSSQPQEIILPPEVAKPERSSPVKAESPVKNESTVISSSLEPAAEVKEDGNKAIFSSPKIVKRIPKVKLFTGGGGGGGSSGGGGGGGGGRGAHMLGLVTKLPISETEEIKMSRVVVVKSKDSEVSSFSSSSEKKKERVKDFASPGGGGSSRQKKIFSNMKTGDYTSSPRPPPPPPPTKLFSNLKNNGEKISPKMEKVKEVGKTDHDYSVAELKETIIVDLPILEWSSANPPSLTASPSVGILKKRATANTTTTTTSINCSNTVNVNINTNVNPNELLNDTPKRSSSSSSSKGTNKHVSFADPPVSKEMGYEVLSCTSSSSSSSSSPLAGKLTKLVVTKSFPGTKKDTPSLKIKSSRVRLIQTRRRECDIKSVEAVKSDDDDDDGNHHRRRRRHLLFDDINIVKDKEQENVQAISIASQDIFVETDDDDDDREGGSGGGEGDKNEISSVEYGTHEESTITKIINGVSQEEVVVVAGGGNNNNNNNNANLEDTVDINNISHFTDDTTTTTTATTIYNKPVYTSSTTVVEKNQPAAVADNASDTLLISSSSSSTDSTTTMFLSSQESINGLAVINKTPWNQEKEINNDDDDDDDDNPICPPLLGCTEPIDSIVENLVHPVWSKNLSKLLFTRNINTVGDLAALSSREYEKLPLKASGSPKIDHVRKILSEYSNMSLSTASATVIPFRGGGGGGEEETVEVETQFNQSLIIEDVSSTQPVVYNDDDDDMNISEVLTTDKIQATITNTTTTTQELNNKEKEEEEEEKSNEFGSIILDNTLSPPKKCSTGMSSELMMMMMNAVGGRNISSSIKDVAVATDPADSKSVGVQMKLEELLDEIDVDLVLASGIKRSCPQSIITSYKGKMGTKNDAELYRETMHLLAGAGGGGGGGMETTYPDTCLKIACREYGASKILGRLPDIFINDKEFFSKVLNTYRMKLNASDLLNVTDTDSVKQELCKKLTSIELCDMLARVLAEEEKREGEEGEGRGGVKTPTTTTTMMITDETCLNSILKRMPIDSVISHTVANDELIPSSVVLDIALQNNSPDIIAAALDSHGHNNNSIKEIIVNKYLTSDKLVTYLKEKQTNLSKKDYIDIYQSVCDKFTIQELLDLNNKIIKDRVKQFE